MSERKTTIKRIQIARLGKKYTDFSNRYYNHINAHESIKNDPITYYYQYPLGFSLLPVIFVDFSKS